MVALSYPVTFFDAAGKEFLMTIYDISEKAGVSIATVSRVLNGACNVSAQTRQKVLSVIEACGYTPNAFARGLGLNSMNTIGILCADSSDLYQANAVYHIERELRQNNYNCILCCTGYGLEDKQKYLNLLVNKKVDSVILVGSAFIADNDAENDYIREAAKEIPVLLLMVILIVRTFTARSAMILSLSCRLPPGSSRTASKIFFFYMTLRPTPRCENCPAIRVP